MKRILIGAASLAALAFASAPAHAGKCDPGKSADDMSYEDAQAVYDCIADSLYKGYQKKNKRWVSAGAVKDYRNWTKVSALPANPGFHSDRYLVTYVNEIGADAYMTYAEDPDIPAGTLIAKESFSITAKGKVRKGPLFLMEKVAEGKSPETMDWYYTAVAPNGAPMAVNIMTACNTCHMENFGHQDALGYPVEEVRVTK